MSTQVFPTLAGLGWSATRTPNWKTRKQKAVAGMVTAIADQQYPIWNWALKFDVLRQGNFSAGVLSEFATLVGFYNARQGGFDTFQYQDSDDNQVVGQPIENTVTGGNAGDGATLSFQLLRAFGGFVEPVLAPNQLWDVYAAGVPVPGTGLTAPSSPTLNQVAGGALAGATYYVKVTLVTPSGETPASAEASLAVSSDNLLTVASPAAGQGAIGWYAYVATSSGAEKRQQAAGAFTPIGTNWTEGASGITSTGAAIPSTSNSFSLTGWGTTTPGIVSFASAPAGGAAITADLSYYFPCRFVEDKCDFEKFMAGRYAVKKLTLESVL